MLTMNLKYQVRNVPSCVINTILIKSEMKNVNSELQQIKDCSIKVAFNLIFKWGSTVSTAHLPVSSYVSTPT